MNKKITNALNAVRNNTTDNTAVANLRMMAVPKFREVYAVMQKAARTVNRHIGDGKGTPNRAKIAMAIGLKTDLLAFDEIATLIDEQTMHDAVAAANAVVTEICTMRGNKKYERVAFLPDYLTDDEVMEEDAANAKTYLANINRAVRKAIATINRHVEAGDFDPNTFKIAKVVGYLPELPELEAKLNGYVGAGLVTADEIDVMTLTADAADKVRDAYVKGKYDTAIPELIGYEYVCTRTYAQTDAEADEGEEAEDDMVC